MPRYPGIAASVSAGGAFSPTDISGLKLWIDGGLSAKTYSTGSIVQQINDLSGNNNHLSNGVADANRPEDGTRTINGIPALNFDGNDCLARGATLGLAGTFHLFFVGIIDAHVSVDTFVDCGGSSDSDDGWRFRLLGTSPKQLSAFLSDGVSVRRGLGSSGDPYTVGTLHLFEFFAAGTGAAGFNVDGASVGTSSSGTAGPGEDNFELMALDLNGSNGMDGAVGAVLVYDSVLAGTDLTNVRAYLDTRFAIPGL